MEVEKKDEVHWEPLTAIAREELGVLSLKEMGKITSDARLLRIAGLARALERAYDLGLLMGHRVSRMSQGQPLEPKMMCHNEQDGLRAAASEWLRTAARNDPNAG